MSSRRSSSRRSSSRLSLANNNPVIEVGDRVTVISSGHQGTCRFSGPTEFAGGHWIGVELDKPLGKNDGSVDETRYFKAQGNCGIFVRSGQLQLENAIHKSMRPGLSPGTLSSASLTPDTNSNVASPELGLKPGRIPVVASKDSQLKTMSKTRPVSPRMTRARAKKADPNPAGSSISQDPPVKKRGKVARSSSEAAKVANDNELPSERGPVSISPKKQRESSRAASVPSKPINVEAETLLTEIPEEVHTTVALKLYGMETEEAHLGKSDISPSVVKKAAARESSPKERAIYLNRKPLKDIESLQYSENLNMASGLPTPTKRIAIPLLSEPVEPERRPSLLNHNTTLEFLQISASDLGGESVPELLPFDDEIAESSIIPEEVLTKIVKYETTIELLQKENHKLSLSNERLLSTQIQTESRLNSSIEKITLQDQEIEDLKKKSLSQNEALKESYNNLQTRYEAAKLDADNARLYSKKLQSEITPLKKKVASLEEALDNRNDAFEMAIVDKCVAEESLEVLKEEIKILKSHVEELALELELGGANETNTVQAITDSHELSIMNTRLTTALIKLRELSKMKQAELESKLKVREADLLRLKNIEDLHSDITENLLRANERIQHLTFEVDQVHESSCLITNLTESNLELDEALSMKRLETVELEQLRKLNNELEEAHIALEASLYRDLDIKDRVIQEFTTRFNKQSVALVHQTDLASKLRIEVDEFRSNPVDQNIVFELEASCALAQQKLRLSEATCESLETELDIANVKIKIAEDDLNLSMDLLSKLSSQFDHRRVKSYTYCRAASRKLCVLIEITRKRNISALSPILFDCQSVFSLLQIPLFLVTNREQIDPIYSLLESEDLVIVIDKLLRRFVDGIYDMSEEMTQFEWVAKQGREIMSRLNVNNTTIPSYIAGGLILDCLSLGVSLTNSLLKEAELTLAKGGLDTDLLKAYTSSLMKHASHTSDTIKNAQNCINEGRYLPKLTVSNWITLENEANISMTETVIALTRLLKLCHSSTSPLSFHEFKDESTAIVSWEIMSSKLKERLVVFEKLPAGFQSESIWNQSCRGVQKELENLPVLEGKLADLYNSLQLQEERVKKQSEVIEAMQAKNLILSKKLVQTDQLKIELDGIRAQLRAAISTKQEYQDALEAMHGDLKDAEAEIDQLKEASEKIQMSARSSPSKRKSLVASTAITPGVNEPINNPLSNLDAQTASIRFLLMENCRLRSNEYSRVAFELFHPSDPLMKRLTKKESADDDEMRAAKASGLSDIDARKNSALKLTREFEQFLATSQVVDLTKTRDRNDDLASRFLLPENQWKVQQLHLSRLLSRCCKLQDFVELPSKEANSIDHCRRIGKLSFNNDFQSLKSVTLKRQDLASLHRSIISF